MVTAKAVTGFRSAIFWCLLVAIILTVPQTDAIGIYLPVEIDNVVSEENRFCPYLIETAQSCPTVPNPGAGANPLSSYYSASLGTMEECKMDSFGPIPRLLCQLYCDFNANSMNPKDFPVLTFYRNGCKRYRWKFLYHDEQENIDYGDCVLFIDAPDKQKYPAEKEGIADLICPVTNKPHIQLKLGNDTFQHHKCECSFAWEAWKRVGTCSEPGYPPCGTQTPTSEPTTTSPSMTESPTTTSPSMTEPPTAALFANVLPSARTATLLPYAVRSNFSQTVVEGSFEVYGDSSISVVCSVQSADADATPALVIEAHEPRTLPATFAYKIYHEASSTCNASLHTANISCHSSQFYAARVRFDMNTGRCRDLTTGMFVADETCANAIFFQSTSHTLPNFPGRTH